MFFLIKKKGCASVLLIEGEGYCALSIYKIISY